MRRGLPLFLLPFLLSSCDYRFLSSSPISSQSSPESSSSFTFSFSSSRFTIASGSSATIPYESSALGLCFFSSDESVAYIEGDRIIGLTPGRATITCLEDKTHSSLLAIVTFEEDFMVVYEDDVVVQGDNLSPAIEGFGDPSAISYSSSDTEVAKVDETGEVSALSPGVAYITASAYGFESAPFELTVLPEGPLESIQVEIESNSLPIGGYTPIEVTTYPEGYESVVELNVTGGYAVGGYLTSCESGEWEIEASYGGVADSVAYYVSAEELADPYENVDKDDFYADYDPAHSRLDALYRSSHSLMSGDIVTPDCEPVFLSNAPKQDGLYAKNASVQTYDDGGTYIIYDHNGRPVDAVYEGGAYITLEQVAAYLQAFGDIPDNQVKSKSMRPTQSPYGEYLRLNHSRFSGSQSSYPYEPILPDITGCGGDTVYYELDIGTTGTSGDGYVPMLYNNGTSVSRGAARICYTVSRNGERIEDPSNRQVFYTYNHYNDFREYLNYRHGWGKIFGNVSGGGELSDDYDCNPTEYPEVALTAI